MGITEALAAVVAQPAAKAELNSDPAAFRQRYGLTAAELDALTKASPLGLRYANNEHRTARLETLQAILPRTLRLLRPAPSRVLGPYMEQVPWETTSIPAEARRLLDWLTDKGGIDPALADLVRYETLMYELAEDPAASRQAIAMREAASAGQWPSAATDRPVLSPAARVASFDHDITADPPTRLERPFHVLAVKNPDRWGPRIYRLADEAVALLLACDGEHTLADVVAHAGGTGAAVLNQLAGYGALTRSTARRP